MVAEEDSLPATFGNGSRQFATAGIRREAFATGSRFSPSKTQR
jgi:hypothetical protein